LLLSGLVLGIALAQASAQALAQASAQNTRSETVYLSMSLEQMLEFLDQSGFSTLSDKDEDGQPYIEIKLGQYNPSLYLEDCKKGQCTTLLLYYGIDLDEGVALEAVNSFNYDHLLVQAFVDQDQDPWLSAALDITGGVTRKNILHWLNSFGQKLPEFKEAMEEAESASGPEAQGLDDAPTIQALNKIPQNSPIFMLSRLFWKNRFPQML
jgi:hypothetical protein